MHVNVIYSVPIGAFLKNIECKFVRRFILEYYGEKIMLDIVFLPYLANSMGLKLNHITYFVRLGLFRQTYDCVVFALKVPQIHVFYHIHHFINVTCAQNTHIRAINDRSITSRCK